MKIRYAGLAASALALCFSSASALEGPGRALAPAPATTAPKLTADTERFAAQSFPTTVKEFIVPYAGKVRIRWQLKSDDNSKNANVMVSSRVETCTLATTETTYKTQTCDIRVVAGDLISVLLFGTAIAPPPSLDSSTAFIRNVRVFYNVVDSTGIGSVKTD